MEVADSLWQVQVVQRVLHEAILRFQRDERVLSALEGDAELRVAKLKVRRVQVVRCSRGGQCNWIPLLEW